MVLECVPEKLATLVTEKLDIPTIGIGAGAGCDGQVLVYQDMLGMYSDMVPKDIETPAGSTVFLLKAEPNYLEYVTDSRKDGMVVFSEIFYPHGWQARIDGKPVPHYRANYVLRALNVPAGKHGITRRPSSCVTRTPFSG